MTHATEPKCPVAITAPLLAILRNGDNEDCVLEKPGPPQVLLANDELRMRSDYRYIAEMKVDRIYCYGDAVGEDQYSIGQVMFAGGNAVFIVGAEVGKMDDVDIDAQRLRGILKMLSELPSLRGAEYDPQPVIQAVNELHEFQKAKAVSACREFLRITPKYNLLRREPLFLVLRLLFDPPAGRTDFPNLGIGDPVPEYLETKTMPRFPISVIADVPFLVVEDYRLFGLAMSVEDELTRLDTECQIRNAPLRPTFDAATIEAELERHCLSCLSTTIEQSRVRAIVHHQIELMSGIRENETRRSLDETEFRKLVR